MMCYYVVVGDDDKDIYDTYDDIHDEDIDDDDIQFDAVII